MTDQPDVRVGHPERAEALDVLSEHFANGYLDVAEFDERSAKAAQATHRSHLTPLLADLPTHAAPALASSNHGSSRGLSQQHDAELELAEVQRKGALVRRADAAIWGVAFIIMFVGIFTSVISSWWFVFPVAFAASWVARNVIGLEDDEEDIFDQLEEEKEQQRAERLEQAMKRRKELGH